jgi:clan AA aspartic protease
MIVGRVRRREPLITLTIRGRGGHDVEIECVVDTGHTGWLTLAPGLIAQLDLPWHSFGQGTLADGSVVLYDVYLAKMRWQGRVRHVRVSELAATPLVGMSLLRGCEFKMQTRSRGRVTITPLANWGRRHG